MHSDAYLSFIAERVAAGDRLAPYDPLITAWWVGLKDNKRASRQPRDIPLPERIRACELLGTRIDLHSAAALHLFARRPRELLELCWAVPLRSVAGALFNAEKLERAQAGKILQSLVKRVALSAEEAHELKRVQRLAAPTEIVSDATHWLDGLAIPLLEQRQSGWAAYAGARAPAGGMGNSIWHVHA